MVRCAFCGHEMIWQSDFNSDEYGHAEGGIISVWQCPHCDTMGEFCWLPEEEGDVNELC